MNLYQLIIVLASDYCDKSSKIIIQCILALNFAQRHDRSNFLFLCWQILHWQSIFPRLRLRNRWFFDLEWCIMILTYRVLSLPIGCLKLICFLFLLAQWCYHSFDYLTSPAHFLYNLTKLLFSLLVSCLSYCDVLFGDFNVTVYHLKMYYAWFLLDDGMCKRVRRIRMLMIIDPIIYLALNNLLWIWILLRGWYLVVCWWERLRTINWILSIVCCWTRLPWLFDWLILRRAGFHDCNLIILFCLN